MKWPNAKKEKVKIENVLLDVEPPYQFIMMNQFVMTAQLTLKM